MTKQKHRRLDEAAELCGINTETLLRFIEWEWIRPVDHSRQILDDEDVARARLILELQQDFGVNQEAIPIILHLIDQLNCIHLELKIKS